MKNYGFRLVSITVGEKSSSNIRKVLCPGMKYFFMQEENNSNYDFFGTSLHVSAIVGKIGCGKSSLIDIMLRMFANVGAVLFRDNNCVYTRNIFAELEYEIDGFICKLVSADKELGIVLPKHKYAYSLSRQFEHHPEFKDFVILNDKKIGGVKGPLNNIADFFPFTIICNFSIHAYCSELIRDSCEVCVHPEAKEKKEHWIPCSNITWIDSVFNADQEKYHYPLIISPNRSNRGMPYESLHYDILKKMESLLFILDNEIDFIPNYELANISYSFTSEDISRISSSRYSSEELSIFKKVLATGKDSIIKIILELYELNLDSNTSDFINGLRMEFVYSVVNYSSRRYSNSVSSEAYISKSDLLNIKELTKEAYDNNKSAYKKIKTKIDSDKSNTAFEINRIFKLLKKIKNDASCIENKTFTAQDYMSFITGNVISKPSFQTAHQMLGYYSSILPPRYFCPEISFKKKDATTSNPDLMNFSDFSSGEKQLAFLLTSVLYHAVNLSPIKGVCPKYRNINIIFDELELCFHPDYQRIFLNRFLYILSQLQLKNQSKYNVLLVTHSPFVLSDIPSSNILYLKEGRDVSSVMKQKTFAANINELLANNFFLSEGFMGEFAKRKIQDLIRYLRHKTTDKSDTERPHEMWGPKKASNVINLIGEPLLVNSLMPLLEAKIKKDKTDEELIAWHEEQIKFLRKKNGDA